MNGSDQGEIRGFISIGSPLKIEWKIDFFSLSKVMDRPFDSPPFNYLDAKWYLRYYLNGASSFTPDWISLYLKKERSFGSKYRIMYHLGIKQADGTVYHSFCDEKDFDGDAGFSGRVRFQRRSSLLRDEWLIAPRGVMTFFCILRTKANRDTALDIVKFEGRSVSTETSEEDLKEAEILSGCEKEALCTPTGGDKCIEGKEKNSENNDGVIEDVTLAKPKGTEKLARDFQNLLTSEKDCDAILKVKNKEFRAHKNILRTRSSVFYSMFDHDMAEKNCGTVDIPDCDPGAFQFFLTYLYSASMDNLSDDIVFNLYFIADKYDTEELKSKCVEFMASNLSVDTFCNAVALALRHEESALLQTATDFFTKNTKEVIMSLQWQAFLKENPATANELYIKSFDHNVIQK